MNYTPLADHVLVKRVEHEADPDKMVKIGSIFIQEEESDECLGGIVMAAGINAVGLSEGDRVYFGKYAGIDVTLDGEKYLVLKKDEILLKKS